MLLAGCGISSNLPVPAVYAASKPNKTTLTVFAAASLTESFTEMAATFEADHPQVKLLLNFAGSNSLRLQIEQGARPDVFASANTHHMDTVFQANLVDQPAIFAHNQLIAIVPADNPASVVTLADLAEPGLKLVLAGPEVPAGRYARQVLNNLSTNPSLGQDFGGLVLSNVVSDEETVKAVVAKVLLGEADAGIVYTSDVTPAVADQVITLTIPAEYNVIADYPISVATDSYQPELAQEFINFVLSARGQAIMADHGFQPILPVHNN
jgi:molybdate transport system substrate-binding protein